MVMLLNNVSNGGIKISKDQLTRELKLYDNLSHNP